MHKFLSMDLITILQRILVLLCIAIPPWLSFIKYFKSKINIVFIALLFIIYVIATDITSELLPFLLVVITIIIIYNIKNEQEIYYLRPLKGKRGEVTLISIGFKIIITVVNLWFALFLKGYGVNLSPQEISKDFMNSSWGMVILLSLLAVIVAPILEEFIFRHTLYRQLSKRIGKLGACLITSVLFALLHFNFLGTISFFGVAILNCYLYDEYGYRAAVVNHCIFNFTSTAMLVLFKAFGTK